MSALKAIPWALQVRAGSLPAKAVLFSLATHCDDTYVASVGVRRVLVAETEGSERTVRRALRHLESLQLVADIPMRYEDGSPAESDYALNVGGWLDDVIGHGLTAVVARIVARQGQFHEMPLHRRIVDYERTTRTTD